MRSAVRIVLQQRNHLGERSRSLFVPRCRPGREKFIGKQDQDGDDGKKHRGDNRAGVRLFRSRLRRIAAADRHIFKGRIGDGHRFVNRTRSRFGRTPDRSAVAGSFQLQSQAACEPKHLTRSPHAAFTGRKRHGVQLQRRRAAGPAPAGVAGFRPGPLAIALGARLRLAARGAGRLAMAAPRRLDGTAGGQPAG